MKKVKDNKKKKSAFYTLMRNTVRLFYPKRKYEGLENIPEEPSVIVGNHAQLHGPFTAELRFPLENRYTWCNGEVTDVSELPEYAMRDFFAYKSEGSRWFYKIISRVIARPLAYIFGRADVIGVYRDARLLSTFRKTVSALNDGYHIVIFPECHTEYNEIINEFQDKFIDVARLYLKSCGRELSFVPMYNAPALRTVVFGKSVKFDGSADIDAERARISELLKKEITALARSLPEHKVVPYANIPRRKYPRSR